MNSSTKRGGGTGIYSGGKNIFGGSSNTPKVEFGQSDIEILKSKVVSKNLDDIDKQVADELEITSSVIEGSSINNTPIGDTNPNTGKFTTLNTSEVLTINDTTQSSNYNNGALVVKGGIGVTGTSRFAGNVHADQFVGCGRHLHNILGENVVGNVVSEPNYLIIRVNQHCVNPPNIAAGINAVGIGNSHFVKGSFSIISGGLRSNLDGRLSSINGGYENKIFRLGNSSVISGGYQNIITKPNVSIIGGAFNNCSGSFSSILGGSNNFISGNYSTASGYKSKITHNGCFLWNDSQNIELSSDLDDQFKIKATGGSKFDSDLLVTGVTNIQDTTIIDGITTINNVTQSTNINNGALVIKGGIGIAKEGKFGQKVTIDSGGLIVSAGNSTFGANLDVTNFTNLNNSTDATSKTQASTVISGGLGVVKKSHFGNHVTIDEGGITVTQGDSTFGSNLEVTGNIDINNFTKLKNNTDASSKSVASTVISGGLGVIKKGHFGDQITIDNGGLTVTQGDSTFGSNLEVTGNIDINNYTKLNNSTDATSKSIAGTVILGGLSVVKKGHFGDKITIDEGGLTVTKGDSSFGSNLEVTGNIDINNFTKLNNITDATSKSIAGTVILGGLSVVKKGHFGNQITIDQGGLTVTQGDSNFGSNLEVTGNININNFTKLNNTTDASSKNIAGTVISGGLGVIKKGHFGDQITIDDGGLTVTQGDSTFGSNLEVTGNIDITNYTKLNNSTDATSKSIAGTMILGGLGVVKKGHFGDKITIDSGGITVLSGDSVFSGNIETTTFLKGNASLLEGISGNGYKGIREKINNIINPQAKGDNSIVIGYNNIVYGSNSSILSGANSNIASNFSSILGGLTNKITGNFSSILNGNLNHINNDYAVASGYGSKSTKYGQIAHSMGYFNSVGDSQINTYIYRREIDHITTDFYNLGINNIDPLSNINGAIQLDNSSILSYNINLVGVSSTSNKFWNYRLTGCVEKNSSGSYIHIKGSKEIIVKNKKSDDVEIDTNTTYGIYIKMKIKDEYTIRWMAKVETVELIYV